MNLEARIHDETIRATKARDKERLSILRMIRAALKNREIEKRAPLTDDDVIQTLSSLVKKARESIEKFREGGREDLVAKEEAELKVILSFLPQQMTEGEIKQYVNKVISELEAKGLKDFGKVMKVVMAELKGKADGRTVNQIVREALST